MSIRRLNHLNFKYPEKVRAYALVVTKKILRLVYVEYSVLIIINLFIASMAAN